VLDYIRVLIAQADGYGPYPSLFSKTESDTFLIFPDRSLLSPDPLVHQSLLFYTWPETRNDTQALIHCVICVYIHSSTHLLPALFFPFFCNISLLYILFSVTVQIVCCNLWLSGRREITKGTTSHGRFPNAAYYLNCYYFPENFLIFSKKCLDKQSDICGLPY